MNRKKKQYPWKRNTGYTLKELTAILKENGKSLPKPGYIVDVLREPIEPIAIKNMHGQIVEYHNERIIRIASHSGSLQDYSFTQKNTSPDRALVEYWMKPSPDATRSPDDKKILGWTTPPGEPAPNSKHIKDALEGFSEWYNVPRRQLYATFKRQPNIGPEDATPYRIIYFRT